MLGLGERVERDGDGADEVIISDGVGAGFEFAGGDGFFIGSDEEPVDLCVFEGGGSEVGELDFCAEGFGGGPYAFGEAGEGDGAIAEAAELFCGDVSFRVPEGVEDPYEGGSLSGEVVEVEELEASEAWGAQGGFDFFFIAEGLEFA